MRVDGVKGEFYFKALYRSLDRKSWVLTPCYFKSKEEAREWFDGEVEWPVDMEQDGFVMVPDPEEICSKPT